MNQEKISVDTAVFRSALIPAAACLCAIATLLGLAGAVGLLNPEYRAYLLQDIIAGGVTAASALRAYTTLHYILAVVAPLYSGLMALCLAVSHFGKAYRGWNILSTAMQWSVRLINAVGIFLVALFVYRFVRYTISCMRIDGGIYPFFAMAIMEGMMLTLAALLFKYLRRFLNDLCDGAASIAYTFSSGKLDSVSIPGFAAKGFLLLGIVCLMAGIGQMFTVTIVYDQVQPYYKLLISEHPAQVATAVAFFCNGAADILLYAYLHRYKRITERALYEQRKRIFDFK